MNSANGPIPPLPNRLANSHKGTYGRILIIGGSVGMSGAAALSGLAALRSGAGLVTLCVPDVCLQSVASFNPCYMTIPCDSNSHTGAFSSAAIPRILEACQSVDVVAVGPGMRHNEETSQIVQQLHANCAKPMVVDADALNCLAAARPLETVNPPRILTPHPGEFRRLVGLNDLTLGECRERAMSFSRVSGVTLILKGDRSIVTDGTRIQENPTGNAGMATGGSGDVLTGTVAALVGQQFEPFDACVLGAFLHGRAGDLAASELGQEGMIASDLIRFLPTAFRLHPHSDDAGRPCN